MTPRAALLAPSNPTSYLSTLAAAGMVKTRTLERIEALLEGRELPPPKGRLGRGMRAAHSARRMCTAADDAEATPEPINRDPCTWCGTRADIGCKHQPASTPEAFA